MSQEQQDMQCYNRGCGQKFDPSKNEDDSCEHHPGQPVFHDAYKGWSCCKKKCIDFTEFLNIKGCTKSKHSNVKPLEPEKPKNDPLEGEVIVVKPIIASKLVRPPFTTPMTIITPELAPSIKQQIGVSMDNSTKDTESKSSEIIVGTICKNGGCNTSYEGPDTDETACIHHPGCPIFHEGMKYWSCCQKKTSDFNAFLNQAGCQHGKHVWVKEENNADKIECRWDHHQTGTHVIVSIYAKLYNPNDSVIKLNPIRLYAKLVFPQQANASFNLDVELRGIVDVKASEVSMYGTKVEIRLKKAEPGSWAQLEVIKQQSNEEPVKTDLEVEKITPQVDAVDLSDI